MTQAQTEVRAKVKQAPRLLFLNSQVNYCVDKGRVTHYIPRCLGLTIHAKFSERMRFVLKSTREV
jgi:hypothetical protein